MPMAHGVRYWQNRPRPVQPGEIQITAGTGQATLDLSGAPANGLAAFVLTTAGPAAEQVIATVEGIPLWLGIPANARDQVFGKFSQVDASDRRAVGGTGLGMSISQSIVGNDIRCFATIRFYD